jgi:hypothetical protein
LAELYGDGAALGGRVQKGAVAGLGVGVLVGLFILGPAYGALRGAEHLGGGRGWVGLIGFSLFALPAVPLLISVSLRQYSAMYEWTSVWLWLCLATVTLLVAGSNLLGVEDAVIPPLRGAWFGELIGVALGAEAGLVVGLFGALVLPIGWWLRHRRNLRAQTVWVRRARAWCESSRPASLDRAFLLNADLRGIRLGMSCHRDGASLRNATLYGANLAGADLRRACLVEADLRHADLRAADMRELRGSEHYFDLVDRLGADLRHADLTDADLRGADLWGAKLEGATLYGGRYDEATIWPESFAPPSEAIRCEL